MNFTQAQQEFRIRHYRWAKFRAAEEISEEFPHFWLFKGGLSWKRYHFMRELNEDEQKLFVSASLKRSHRYAAAGLGETTSAEEKALEERYFSIRERSPFEKELAARRRMGEKTKFASKRKVQRAMLSSFEGAFGYLGLEAARHVGQESSHVPMKFGGWIVQTSFYFGRSQSLIDYNHVIASEEQIRHPTTPGVTGPALLLANALCWINLGKMEWDYLTDTDVEPACDSVITLCREFFGELPKLLGGLEPKNIERENMTP